MIHHFICASLFSTSVWLSGNLEGEHQTVNHQLTLIANSSVDNAGWGTLGLGDKSFGISVDSVRQASTTPAFVKTFSTAWRSRHSGQVSATMEVASSTQLSCYQERGFCKCGITNASQYKQMISFLTMVAQKHRRSHLVRGKNQGPSNTIQHPLLVAFERTSSRKKQSICYNMLLVVV